mgnify:CR=1 FL=1
MYRYCFEREYRGILAPHFINTFPEDVLLSCLFFGRCETIKINREAARWLHRPVVVFRTLFGTFLVCIFGILRHNAGTDVRCEGVFLLLWVLVRLRVL